MINNRYIKSIDSAISYYSRETDIIPDLCFLELRQLTGKKIWCGGCAFKFFNGKDCDGYINNDKFIRKYRKDIKETKKEIKEELKKDNKRVRGIWGDMAGYQDDKFYGMYVYWLEQNRPEWWCKDQIEMLNVWKNKINDLTSKEIKSE